MTVTEALGGGRIDFLDSEFYDFMSALNIVIRKISKMTRIVSIEIILH